MNKKDQTITIDDLAIGYSYKKSIRVVAEHISSTIYSGELTCLLGANGIGKSTLLRTLIAFQPKLSGKIFIYDKEIEKYTEKELANLISVVLTEKFDIKNMTSYELISLGRSPYTGFWGKLSYEDKKRIDEAISLVKIQRLSSRMIDTLSDGERQKVMIAKALAQDTPIILLDEPTAFLDFPSKVEIMQLLHRLSRKTNKTIFLSTHDLELALQIADKIWLMDAEHGIQTGVPEDLSLNGSLSSFFSRKGIIFDQNSGLFRMENNFYRKIKVVGHGVKYAMIRKAFSRNGILVSRDVETDMFVEVRDNQIILYNQDQSSVSITSIEELLNHVMV